jgi:site-specific recombinase XerD
MHTLAELNTDLTSRFARWLPVQGYSADTQRQYIVSVVSFCDFLHQVSALEATHLDIRDYLAIVAQRGVKRTTVHKSMYAIRCFYDFLNLGGLINWAPPRFIRLRQVPRTVPRVISEKQVRSLLSAARDLHERTMIELLYGTGARAGEARSMKVEDIDLQARRIRVMGKCGQRFVLFPRAITNYLRKYIGKRRNGYLFFNRCPARKLHLMRTKEGAWRSYYYLWNSERGISKRIYWYVPQSDKLNYRQALRRFQAEVPKSVRDIPIGQKPLGRTTVRYVIKKVGLRIGLHVNPYMLRHAFATHLIDRGADILMIQKMLGHFSVGTTQKYTFVSMTQVQKILDKCHPRNS